MLFHTPARGVLPPFVSDRIVEVPRSVRQLIGELSAVEDALRAPGALDAEARHRLEQQEAALVEELHRLSTPTVASADLLPVDPDPRRVGDGAESEERRQRA